MDSSKWRDYYKKANKQQVHIKVLLKDNKHFFFPLKSYYIWKEVGEYCNVNGTFVKEMELQFRSHKCPLEIKDPVALYLVRSAMGEMGGDTTNYVTFGVLKEDGKVYKQMWMVPELIKDMEFEEDIEDCFEEAFIYDEKKKKIQQEQVQA